MKTQTTTRRNFLKVGAAAAAAGVASVPALASADSVGDAIGKLFGGGDDSSSSGDSGGSGAPAAGSVDYPALFEKGLNENGLKFDRLDTFRFRVQFSGDNFDDIDIRVFFEDDGGNHVHFFCWSMGNASSSVYEAALAACNAMNDKFYYAKFCVDSDSDIAVEVDAIVDEYTAGDELVELLYRMANIIDDAYPDIYAALSGTYISA